MSWVAAVLVALLAALAVAWTLARNASRLRLLDVPNARSSHTTPTPRGGGVGIVAGVLIGLAILAAFGEDPMTPASAAVVGGFVVMALVGAWDDVRPIPALVRLCIQAGIATAVAVKLGPVSRLPLPAPLDGSLGLTALPVTVIWLMAVTNFFNFMDGIDGLASGQSVASCIGIAVASWSNQAVTLASVIGAASLGFLVLNRPPARIFLGDAGSTSLGFVFASLPLLAPAPSRSAAVFAVAVGLALFLLDPLETLFRLVRVGAALGLPHRSHSYQILAPTKNLHFKVSSGLVLSGGALAILGGLSYQQAWLQWPALALAALAFGTEKILTRRQSRSRMTSAVAR